MNDSGDSLEESLARAKAALAVEKIRVLELESDNALLRRALIKVIESDDELEKARAAAELRGLLKREV